MGGDCAQSQARGLHISLFGVAAIATVRRKRHEMVTRFRYYGTEPRSAPFAKLLVPRDPGLDRREARSLIGEDMGILVKSPDGADDGADEVRHWSAINLWSDGKRRQLFSEGTASPEDIREEEAFREAKVGADQPLLLTASTVADGDGLRQYLLSPAMSRWDYHLLRLACSFKKGAGERFARADLSIDLRQVEDGQEHPVAWSMSPLVLLDGDDRTDTITVGAGLKFVTAEVSRQVKASQNSLLRAYGLLTANPSWKFTATRAGDLEGIFELALIVRSLRGGAVQGKLTLDVLVEQQRRLGPSRSAEIKGASSLLVGYSGADGGIFFELT